MENVAPLDARAEELKERLDPYQMPASHGLAPARTLGIIRSPARDIT
jgi:hypothetical protein